MSDPTPRPADPGAPARPSGPLGPLAVSFSGGGYRAAAFHLGGLRLLHRAELIDDVVALSTVSGGTILGVPWVVSGLEGEPFERFYDRFKRFMARHNVIHEALETLTDHREHGTRTWPSLIRSAADVYAHPELLGDRRFGALIDAAASGGRWQELIFNSTEFRTGVDFRFRASQNPHARIGNGNFRVPRAVARHFRLADIAAASSCFPGGFEPLLFPEQFDWPDAFPLEKAKAELGPDFPSLALMDGGIYDNQGVDSLVLAYDKSEAATLVISDVSTPEKDIYNYPAEPRKRGWLTLRGVSWLAWITFAAAAVSAGMLAWTWWGEVQEGERGWGNVFLYLVPFLFALGVAGGLVYLRILLKDAQEVLKKDVQIGDAFNDLGKLTVLELLSLLQLRVGSLLKLTSSIFMKRIRGLVYKGVYQDEQYKGKRMANLIYALADDHPKLYKANPWLVPSAALLASVRQAKDFGTTLWFDDVSEMDAILVTGEATLCFTLIRFILDNHPDEVDTHSPIGELFARLRGLWDGLNGAAAGRGKASVATPKPAVQS
ncbi:MAG TPA: patatin-like phospholipase family protein [Longimicrobium sp.]|nr:patatin-like phospholipase family protein [Longimicrobium sp.]